MIVSNCSEVLVGKAQAFALILRGLLGQAAKAFQPQFTAGGYLVAFLGEYDWKEAGKGRVSANFGRHAEQQMRLAAAAGSDDEGVRARACAALAQGLYERVELRGSDAERGNDLVVSEEARIVFLNCYRHCS